MKTGICVECGKEGPIKAKGMCTKCYKSARRLAAKKPKSDVVVVLDFRGREGLFEELKARAEKEYRPLEWQIMRDLDVEARHVVV